MKKAISPDIASTNRSITQVTSFAMAVVRNQFRDSEHFNKYLAIEE